MICKLCPNFSVLGISIFIAINYQKPQLWKVVLICEQMKISVDSFQIDFERVKSWHLGKTQETLVRKSDLIQDFAGRILLCSNYLNFQRRNRHVTQ